jgi:hypothetical protein
MCSRSAARRVVTKHSNTNPAVPRFLAALRAAADTYARQKRK